MYVKAQVGWAFSQPGVGYEWKRDFNSRFHNPCFPQNSFFENRDQIRLQHSAPAVSDWCRGSTLDFESEGAGSIPVSGTRSKSLEFESEFGIESSLVGSKSQNSCDGTIYF